MAPEGLDLRCVRNPLRYFVTLLRLCPELFDGPIAKVQAMSRMICVIPKRGRSDPNLNVHPSPDVPQALMGSGLGNK